MLLMFGIIIVLFGIQCAGCMYQIRNYKKAVRRVHKLGNVGIGQKKGGFSFGHLVLIVCDSSGIIKCAEVMEGMSFLAPFKPKESILGRKFAGAHIEDFLEEFRKLEPKKRRRYKGYIQALEALDMRLYPEHYSEEQLNGAAAAG